MIREFLTGVKHLALIASALWFVAGNSRAADLIIFGAPQEGIVFLDRAETIVPIQHINWATLMAFGLDNGMSREGFARIIVPISRGMGNPETFESVDSRERLVEAAMRAHIRGVARPLASARILIAYLTPAPNYNFESSSFPFCYPRFISIPSHVYREFPLGAPAVQVDGGIRTSNYGNLVSLVPWSCSLQNDRGRHYSWAFPERDIETSYLVPNGPHPRYAELQGLTPNDAVDIRLYNGLDIPLDQRRARLMRDLMQSRGNVVWQTFECRLVFSPGRNPMSSNPAERDSFHCDLVEATIGYLEPEGELLRATYDGSEWRWQFGNAFLRLDPTLSSDSNVQLAPDRHTNATVGSERSAVGDAYAGSSGGQTLSALLDEAESAYARAVDEPLQTRAAAMAAVQAILEQIVDDFPTSDAAISILLGEDLGTIPTAVVAGLAAVQPGAPVLPQTAAPSTSEPVAALTLCYRQAIQNGQPGDSPVSITVRAEIGPDGELVGIPTLEVPVTPDAVARRMFQNALAALDLCAPPPGTPLPGALAGAPAPLLPYASQRILVVLDADRVVSVAPLQQPAAPAAAASAPAGSSLAPVPRPQTGSANPPAANTPSWRAATEQDQARLNLSRQDIREIQARLTAMGFDPRGIDGAAGPGTRRAISAWQRTAGIPDTGFLDRAQLDEFRRQSETQFAAWRADPQNRRQLTPPDPVPITPATVSGRWSYTSTCGRNSRLPGQTITGEMQIVYRGGATFTGALANSQGLRAQLSGRISGRTIVATARWGLLIGSTYVEARISDDARTVSGRDSLGCTFRARKR